ncbi:MAG: helix-turn-helix domain-containing protein [bacterium]
MMHKNQEGKIKEALLQFDLNEKEIKAYLAILQIGDASVLSISKGSGLSRGTVFDIAEKLKMKGYISEIKKGKKRRFIVESPTNQFYSLLDRQHEKLKKSKKMVDDILPIIKAMNVADDFRPQMKVYAGFSGFKKVWDEIWQCKEKVFLSVARIETFAKFSGEEFLTEIQEAKIKHGFTSRAINEDSPSAREMQKNDKKYARETRLAPKEFQFPSTEIIFGDKIAMFSTVRENIILVIESKDFAATHKAYFEMLWRMLG